MSEQTSLRESTYHFLTAPEQLTAVIASTSANHAPHATVVYYYLDRDFNLYFLTATETQKYTNLCANPHAAYAVGYGPDHTTVQGSGPATLLDKGSEEEKTAIAYINERMREQDASWAVFQLDEYEDNAIAVFKIATDSLYVLNLEPTVELPITPNNLQQVI